ncbi:MAG TPA: gephyrin-like molybdotransferase Glp [Polyangia bacterium]|nr:gephyrin-like molybdotransferase Glp [Polyangia bacterium]
MSRLGRPSLTLLPADEARRILADTRAVGTERMPLADAAGRVLAGPFAAPDDLPAERRSVMDGYAVRAADLAGASPEAATSLNVIGAVPMGAVFAGGVGPGQAVAIATGGFVPEGADAVVMVEHTRMTTEAIVTVTRSVPAGANVVQPGEDLARGEGVLPAGRRLRAQDLALLATFGVTTVDVHRQPRVALLSTGNELCAPDATPGPGQVRDTNQIALAAQVAAAGCIPTLGGIIPDDVAALRDAIRGLLAAHHAVILTGGSSIGTKDLCADAVADLPAPGVLFHGIDIRQGKPTLFARAGNRPVVGLPGFPTSSLVVFDAFIRPMLWRLGGEVDRDSWPSRRSARLGAAHKSVGGREDYLRVRLVSRDGELWADPLPGGSATLSNVVRADALVRVEADRLHIAAGEPVEALLYV